MKRILLVLVIAMTATSAYAANFCVEPSKEPFKVGEKVIADKDGPTFSIATVDGINGEYVSIKFPDGGTGNLRTRYVAHMPANVPPCYSPGDKVVAQVDKVIWREGRIAELTDSGAAVEFVDGSKATKKFSEIVRHPTRY